MPVYYIPSKNVLTVSEMLKNNLEDLKNSVNELITLTSRDELS